MCLYLSEEGKYLQHILECGGCLFLLHSHTAAAFYVPGDSSQPPTRTYTPPYAKGQTLRDSLRSQRRPAANPKIQMTLTSRPLLQVHCRPQPGPVRNIRLVLAQGFVHWAHCLDRKYSCSGYPLCSTEPRLLCRGTQHFHSI